MSERDYNLVSALQRLRAAEDLARKAMPQLVIESMDGPWLAVLRQLNEMTEQLEAEVMKARAYEDA